MESVKSNLKSETFHVTDNNGKASFWKSYQNVRTKENTCTNYVRCRFCGRIDKYDTKGLGSKSLTNHAVQCNSISKPIDSYLKRQNVVITTEEKKLLANAAASFCCMDIRPFHAIQGAGLNKLLVDFSAVVAKHGRLDAKEVQQMLPCPNTVFI